MHHLVWFRTDLRVEDNPALYAASKLNNNTDKLSAIYIDCYKQYQSHGISPIQRDFFIRNLECLSTRLAELGVPLEVKQLDTYDDIPDFLDDYVSQLSIDAIFANTETGINERRRDKSVSKQLDIPFNVYNGNCVIVPGKLLAGNGEMYKVFTPYSRAWLSYLSQNSYACYPAPEQGKPVSSASINLHGQRVASEAWEPGEQAAQAKLREFCETGLIDYEKQRDIPAIEGTSKLSAYLAIGVISIRQCLHAIETELGHLPMSKGEPGFTWLNELIWREFYHHLMFAYPRLSMQRAFKPETDKLAWADNPEYFEAWCTGMTGYPIVDAAMRCLNQTGWMHNRLRMIVASFLTKDLHIDWKQGEAYFMSRLIDGELAANNGGWQWAAGTGADAAPYFRVFNPTTQGKRFDADGEFIRRWIPELQHVPAKYIHEPYSWLEDNNQQYVYPAPIVDHAVARQYAIAMFKALK